HEQEDRRAKYSKQRTYTYSCGSLANAGRSDELRMRTRFAVLHPTCWPLTGSGAISLAIWNLWERTTRIRIMFGWVHEAKGPYSGPSRPKRVFAHAQIPVTRRVCARAFLGRIWLYVWDTDCCTRLSNGCLARRVWTFARSGDATQDRPGVLRPGGRRRRMHEGP